MKIELISKKYLVLLLLIFHSQLLFPQAYQLLTIQGDGINVRIEPNTNSKIVTKLNTTDECKVLSVGEKGIIKNKEDYWYKIDYNSKIGWVFGAFTSLKQEGRKTIEAKFEDCDVGDMEHIIFIDDENNELDFGGAPNNLGNYKLCIIPKDDWMPTGNPMYIGKKFNLTYSINKCLIKGYDGNPDGVIIDRPTIIELKEILVE